MSPTRDYPRVCGGTRPSRRSAAPVGGLSPRVRGNPYRSDDVEPAGRTIPACAGEPTSARSTTSAPRDYPRVCGGTFFRRLSRDLFAGLSPRVRGNLSMHGPVHVARRTIPACAGEPCPPATSASLTQGLSPRVRGNPLPRDHVYCVVGTIPACAGEPPAASARRHRGQDYPRVCGGTVVRPRSRSPPRGLSPRVRGNLRPDRPRRRLRGTIPACAGEPPARLTAHPPAEDYPRVCGGTQTLQLRHWQTQGLSPRVRGNLRPDRPRRGLCGTIPACAGEPPPLRPGATSSKDYPRVCGGTDSSTAVSRTVPGLSPRVRGNL